MSVHSSRAATYDDHGRLLIHTHDSTANREIDFPENPTTIYLTGDDDLNNSRRMVIDDITGVPTVETFLDGVWNLGELQLSQGSLLLGRDVSLSAAGHHIIVSTPDLELQSILLEELFDDSGSGPPLAPILGPLQSRVVRQPDDSAEQTLTDHTSEDVATGRLLSTAVYLKTGSVAASEDVAMLLSEGIPPNDIVLFKINFPASVFPANSEIVIDITPGVQFVPGTQLNLSITSDVAFSMRYNAAETLLWIADDIQQLGHEDILTETLVLAGDLSIAFSNNLELARPNKVFT